MTSCVLQINHILPQTVKLFQIHSIVPVRNSMIFRNIAYGMSVGAKETLGICGYGSNRTGCAAWMGNDGRQAEKSDAQSGRPEQAVRSSGIGAPQRPMALTLSGMALATGELGLRIPRQNPRLAPCGSPHRTQSECHCPNALNHRELRMPNPRPAGTAHGLFRPTDRSSRLLHLGQQPRFAVFLAAAEQVGFVVADEFFGFGVEDQLSTDAGRDVAGVAEN